MSEDVITISIKGLESVRLVVKSVPGILPLEAVKPTLLETAELMKEVMKASIMRTTGEKSTGALADSIEAQVIFEGEDRARIIVGSELEKAPYVARGVPQTNFASSTTYAPQIRGGLSITKRGIPVEVLPGKWRFIGVRPAMKAHPFVDETAAAGKIALADYYKRNLSATVKEVDAAQKAVSDVEEK